MSTDDTAPPRPRPCLRVGVTGHRPGAKLSGQQAATARQTVDRLLGEIAGAARVVLAREAWAFDSVTPQLTVVSALAEGADRIVADAGLAAGYGLRAVLPFHRGEFRKDFASEAAQQDYDRLLAHCEAVFELDGGRDHAGRAYEAAGVLMLANADLVIAIWDQQPADGLGGTAAIVERALAEDVPVILIDPADAGGASLLWRADAALPTAREGVERVLRRPIDGQLAGIVDILLAPPRDSGQRAALKALLDETTRRWNVAVSYPLLLSLLGIRALRWSDLRTPAKNPDDARRWRDYLVGRLNDESLRPIDTDTLYRGYTAIDHLSTRYAQIYRSAYVFNFIAGAAAVLLATVGLIAPSPDMETSLNFKAVMVTAEIALIVSILVVLHLGTTRQWHRRWLEYRRLAEELRHLRMLAPTAAAARVERPSDRAGRAYGWISWYVRAVEREIPVPDTAVDQTYLVAVRDAVCDAELSGQIAWNARNAEAMEKAAHRLHYAGNLLFWATLAICIGFLVLFFLDGTIAEALREWTVFLTALFPAIGAALSAIRSQADFETVARRSHETAADLASVERAMMHEPLEFARLTDRIEKAVDVMMADNAEWHVLFRTRPLSLPA
ncbi:MAG: DUF4231 domain-containing protein [Proteobacteria bacterium]|nr:DUF4231 domain-containing protein [Pseudomonadota bacterium]